MTFSNILILNSFFSENLVADVRIWECDKFPNWLQKTYRVKAADFCKAQWDDRYFSSQPQCNDKVLPTISFYDRSNNNYDGDSLCTINLNEAEDGNIDKLCPELDSILNSSFEGDLKMFSNKYLYYIIFYNNKVFFGCLLCIISISLRITRLC